jgi:hypothetical protein
MGEKAEIIGYGGIAGDIAAAWTETQQGPDLEGTRIESWEPGEWNLAR